jgi:hypothetical protein
MTHRKGTKITEVREKIKSPAFPNFVSSVCFVVNTSPSKLAPGGFAGDSVYRDVYALTRFGQGDKRTLALSRMKMTKKSVTSPTLLEEARHE